MSKIDLVNNPPHYNKHGVECIDAILIKVVHNAELKRKQLIMKGFKEGAHDYEI